MKRTMNITHQRLRRIMRSRGIGTYKELCEMAGLGVNTITGITKGAGWRSDTLQKLADTLMCHPYDLIEIRGYPPPTNGDNGDQH